jgi:hypothetical protein
MLLLFIVNALVILNSLIIARLFFSYRSFSDYAVSVFLIFYAQVILILQTLGIFGRLYTVNIVSICFFLSAACLLVWRFAPAGNKKGPGMQFSDKLSLFSGIERFAISALAGFFLVKLFIVLFNSTFGWDNLNYHFTFPVEWLKSGNLGCPISIFGDPSVSYYPINGSLFYFWLIFPLKNVFLANIGQYPFFICAFLATYSLARKLDVSPRYAFLAACLFSLVPNYFKQLKIAYIDIMDAALFMFTLNFLFEAKKSLSLKSLSLAALSCGLLLGTKTTAMPLVLLLLLGIGLVCFLSFRRRLLPALSVCAAAVLIFGGYAYIHNFLITGNPLYPLNFKVFGTTLFKGVIDNSVYRTGIFPGDFGLRKLLFSEGLGVQTVLFVLPVVLLSYVMALKKIRKEDTLDYLKRYLFVLPVLIYLVFRLVYPMANVRYVYCLLAVSLITAFYFLERFPKLRRFALAVSCICILASLGELAKKSELVLGFVVSIAVYLLLPSFLAFFRKFTRVKAIFVVAAAMLFLLFAQGVFIKNEYSSYVNMARYSGFWPDSVAAWKWVNEHTKGENIAYTGRPTPFALYGTGFKNNVRYISVNAVEPVMLHYFPKSNYVWGYEGGIWITDFESENNYRGGADYDIWMNNLRKAGIDMLFVYSGLSKNGTVYPVEDQWALEHPDKFKQVFSNNEIRIYRVVK